MKTALPKLEPGYHQRYIIPMMRIGKNGNKLKVFKIRTMYPFSEYLQEYVVGMNGYNTKGKPNNDFRLTPLGRFIRKYWIDELPQVYNLLRGELALVGVRPLSEARFKELPIDIRERRIHYKPGCIPPYVALLMPDSKGNIEAERIYLSEKEKYPHWTDIKYFFKAIFNVLSGKILSS
ncbi:sugar transferase [Carboxylicivirga linearis]|uniref:Sugar transferase n=2 Tax=Carboxylicivirga linearis TaxID=1628157 RepID=A0ABS5K245_9BACT|nr:sugar transferase [Carboxylicivirga linearis]